MLKTYVSKVYNYIHPLYEILREKIIFIKNRIVQYCEKHITSWWQIAAIISFVIIFLYYPIGGMMIHNIDTSSSYRPQTEDGRFASIDMISHLINREAHHKIWTPNLPILFPSYFLDNMPSFQLGLMSSIGKTASALNHLTLSTTSKTATENLNEAIELLQYPGNIWLLSPQNHLPAPSSASQYKKGRKKLNNFNQEIAAGTTKIDITPQNLSVILHLIIKDLNSLIAKNEDHIRENNQSLLDLKSDDIFYFAQGKAYGYYQILKALTSDFKPLLITENIYQQWTSMLNLLEKASDLNPLIIRNGKPNSSFTPNHLIAINNYISQTVNRLNSIKINLTPNMDHQ